MHGRSKLLEFKWLGLSVTARVRVKAGYRGNGLNSFRFLHLKK